MKCEICNVEKHKLHFYVSKKDEKLNKVCRQCQSKLRSEKILNLTDKVAKWNNKLNKIWGK